MSFDRELDVLVAILVAFVGFVGCVFSGALTVASSLLIAAGVFLIGLLFGRRVAEIALTHFHG
ncbi:MAG TPA: hypothetical protein VFI38_07865 [Candidatus Acidoferrum sp.]|nr:hypothetical protein [Candidatus Acidoferrum sp.]